ncbi:lipoate--protein ligase family protein [Candidatus Thorarchaeota archaeon]|nr:MAG: lipoate--protein ligase family protein [Candidatus Thorarchaeota archaeon]
MEELRFLGLSTHSAFENMAIDEAVMLAIKDGSSPPTFRLYRWKPDAVSIGTFQSMRDEVDLVFCQENGIDYIRRITGGGAVFHDYEGEITYSLILPRKHRLVPDDIIDSYEIVCSGIVRALRMLGIDSQFRPINDIVVGERKVSGNAQTRRHGCMLQHGTVLLDLDVVKMFQVLKVPAEKVSDKMIADVKQRVTSIRDIVGRKVPFEELKSALVDGFSESLGMTLSSGNLSASEEKRAKILAQEKYSTGEWNLAR